MILSIKSIMRKTWCARNEARTSAMHMQWLMTCAELKRGTVAKSRLPLMSIKTWNRRGLQSESISSIPGGWESKSPQALRVVLVITRSDQCSKQHVVLPRVALAQYSESTWAAYVCVYSLGTLECMLKSLIQVYIYPDENSCNDARSSSKFGTYTLILFQGHENPEKQIRKLCCAICQISIRC